MTWRDALAQKAIDAGANPKNVAEWKAWSEKIWPEQKEKIVADQYQPNEHERALRDIHVIADSELSERSYTASELAEVILDITKQFFTQASTISDEDLLAEFSRRGLGERHFG